MRHVDELGSESSVSRPHWPNVEDRSRERAGLCKRDCASDEKGTLPTPPSFRESPERDSASAPTNTHGESASRSLAFSQGQATPSTTMLSALKTKTSSGPVHAKSGFVLYRLFSFNGRSQSPVSATVADSDRLQSPVRRFRAACRVPFGGAGRHAAHLRLQSPFRLILGDVAVSAYFRE